MLFFAFNLQNNNLFKQFSVVSQLAVYVFNCKFVLFDGNGFYY